ncbi:MAG: putative toxin-antitoxin system toxin component, PIN family [Pseudomonadota bacterium]|nr:putative toxin-antitoxin system toxin component, PIN family [Pseudomonadota bacterium]
MPADAPGAASSTTPVVLDTNLVVSAIIAPHGMAAQALAVALQAFEPVISHETLAELADVLSRPKFDRYLAADTRKLLLQDYAEAARIVAIPPDADPVTDCADARDNKFLLLAKVCQARLLVTGDKRDLLVMHPWRGVAIMGIRDFVEHWRQWA